MSNNIPWHINLQANLIESEIKKESALQGAKPPSKSHSGKAQGITNVNREAKGPIITSATNASQGTSLIPNDVSNMLQETGQLTEREQFKDHMRTKQLDQNLMKTTVKKGAMKSYFGNNVNSVQQSHIGQHNQPMGKFDQRYTTPVNLTNKNQKANPVKSAYAFPSLPQQSNGTYNNQISQNTQSNFQPMKSNQINIMSPVKMTGDNEVMNQDILSVNKKYNLNVQL